MPHWELPATSFGVPVRYSAIGEEEQPMPFQKTDLEQPRHQLAPQEEQDQRDQSVRLATKLVEQHLLDWILRKEA